MNNLGKKKKRNVKDFLNKDYIDDDGNAVVDVIINDRSELFSPYSQKMLLKRDIFLYLDIIADPIPNDYPLIINFYVKNLSELNQEYVKEALKRYYWFSYKEMQKNLKMDILYILVYLVLGSLLLLFINLVDLGLTGTWKNVVDSFVTIFVWVIWWEAISQLIIGRRQKITEMNNEKQMALAEVRFIDKTDL